MPETADIYENLTGREYLTFIGELYGMEYQEVSNFINKKPIVGFLKEGHLADLTK